CSRPPRQRPCKQTEPPVLTDFHDPDPPVSDLRRRIRQPFGFARRLDIRRSRRVIWPDWPIFLPPMRPTFVCTTILRSAAYPPSARILHESIVSRASLPQDEGVAFSRRAFSCAIRVIPEIDQGKP